jgi:hypothetical protein
LKPAFSVLGSIIRAVATVKTLPVRYVVEGSVFLDVDGRIGQNRIDRLAARK